MAVFGGIWRYLAVFGGIWRYLAVFGGIWRYLAVFGGIWRYLAVFGGIGRYWAVLGGIGRYWAVLGGIGRYWAVYAVPTVITRLVHAKRIGSFGGTNAQSKKKYIATLKRKDDAVTLHKNGRGYAFWGATTAENVWVNPDLPKCDRDAKMLSRRAQPDRSEPAKQRRSKREPNKEPGFVPVVKPSSVGIKPDSKIDT